MRRAGMWKIAYLNIILIINLAIQVNSTEDALDVSKLVLNGTEFKLASAANTSQPILLSSDGAYAWQFFPYNNNTQRMLVILSTFLNTTVVWIANRDRPVSRDASLQLQLPARSLALREANGTIIWSPPVSNISAISMNTTGNLYITSATAPSSANNIAWQSFDEPADVFVPGQRLPTNHNSTASLSSNNWASGHYTLRAEPGGAVLYATFDAQQTMVPYAVLNYVDQANDSLAIALHSSCNHTSVLYNEDASGVTLVQEGSPSLQCLQEDTNAVHGIGFASRMGGEGYRFLRVMGNGDIYSFFLSNSTGLQLDNKLFEGYYRTSCKLPSYCGVNGLCSSAETCTCPPLFGPIDPSDLTQGCRLQTPLNCTIFRQHQFLPVSGAEYYANTYVAPRKYVENPTDCTNLCLENCSCTAAFHNNNTGACHLYDQLHTMQSGLNPEVTAYLRVAFLPATDQANGGDPISRKVIIGVSLALAVGLVIVVGLVAWISRRLMKEPLDEESDLEEEAFLEGLPGLPPRFSYKELQVATDGFSKRLGTGGSGAVYEGHLLLPNAGPDRSTAQNNGKQQAKMHLVTVAVKELTVSEYSNIAAASKRQFRAEVATLGNLSHVNLVQLKGFCAEGMHRLLIYEYVENGSLDNWIFSNAAAANSANVLPWEVRYQIAVDTARGLAFLHEECREKVMHLDVKPQNILLDGVFRARLADFGLSKLMERGHSQTVTAMRGTPGYMAPEWFLNLPVTDRSDVFSYGMVLLELVGGRKNLNTAAATSEKWYFPAWALKQAGNGRIQEVVDKRLLVHLHSQNDEAQQLASLQADMGGDGGSTIPASLHVDVGGHGGSAIPPAGLMKMERLIKVAFWCIQEDASSRPSMTRVVLMLEGHVQVPEPPLEMAYVPRLRAAGRGRFPSSVSSTATTTTNASTAPPISSSSVSGAADVTSLLSPR